MKTIIVLTDFSINADYTAHYALSLAQQLHANLLVCNAYRIPAGEETALSKSRPTSSVEEDSINDLGELTARLKSSLDQAGGTSGFKPDISQCSKEGAVEEQLNELVKKHDILMAVISAHSANYASEYLSKDHARAIVENTCVPVLVIPYQVRFRSFRTIAFASAINYTDIGILDSLTGLAKYSDAVVLVAHVSGETSNDEQKESAIKHFFTQIPGKIKYPGTLYRNIKEKNVPRGLRWLAAHTDVDLLVLVHRQRSRFQQLFGGSVTRKMLRRPYKPLLVFPGSTINAS